MADQPWTSDAKWQALRDRFVERLTVRFTAMREAWSAIRDGDAGDASWSTFFHEVHSLAGSGATFGYEELSETARCLEKIIDPLHRRPGAPLEAELWTIAELFAKLESVAHATNPEI